VETEQIRNRKAAKLTVVFVLLALFIVVICGWYSKASNEANISLEDPILLDFSLNKVEIISNDHVGNSWGFEGYINDKKINISEKFSLPVSINDKIKYQANVEEYDSIPDKGFKEGYVNVKDIDLKNSSVTYLEVSVRENRGRYSGHKANIRFEFTAARHITFSDILRHMFK
jgi:hypothetical protein